MYSLSAFFFHYFLWLMLEWDLELISLERTLDSPRRRPTFTESISPCQMTLRPSLSTFRLALSTTFNCPSTRRVRASSCALPPMWMPVTFRPSLPMMCPAITSSGTGTPLRTTPSSPSVSLLFFSLHFSFLFLNSLNLQIHSLHLLLPHEVKGEGEDAVLVLQGLRAVRCR